MVVSYAGFGFALISVAGVDTCCACGFLACVLDYSGLGYGLGL